MILLILLCMFLAFIVVMGVIRYEQRIDSPRQKLTPELERAYDLVR